MTGTQSDSIGTDACGSDPVAGDESKGPMTPPSQEVGSVFGFDANESAASVAGSIHPSSEGTTCSQTKSGAIAGVMSRILSDGRSRSCTS